MAFAQDNGGAPRQMFDVSSMGLTCATCGVAINELPFQPSSDRPVYCRDCRKQSRGSMGGNGGGNFGGGARTPRPMNDVSHLGLKCASCGTGISELPFMPSTDRPVYCRDCNKQRQQGSGGGSRNRY